MSKLTAAAVAALAGLFALGVTGAPAHTVDSPAKVTINDDSFVRAARSAARNYTFDFFGKVKSKKAACEKERTVVLIDLNADNANEDPPEVVGEDQTDAQGEWRISNSTKPQADLYRAKVRKKVLRRGNGHKHVCAKGASKDYFFYPF